MGVDLVWPGGEHLFALRIGELEALQQAAGCGPGQVLSRLHMSMVDSSPVSGPWMIADVVDTLRLGLIGGGMGSVEARNLVLSTAERVGLPALVPSAAEALLGSLTPREEEDEPGKPAGAVMPPESGTSQSS